MEKAFLFLAEGFEEMEAIAVADVLLRGGVKLQTTSVPLKLGQIKNQISLAHLVRIVLCHFEI